MEQHPSCCLSIGGSDSCGGAGIQADLRVFAGYGLTGCSAITALTAQNPRRVSRIEAGSLAQLDAELHAVFDYYDVLAVKTGMLFDADRIAVIAAALHERHSRGVLIIDPVMVASSGRRLLDAPAVNTLIKALLPLATLLTPNLDEAAVLLNRPVNDASADCAELVRKFDKAVLLKGGHADGNTLIDILCDTDGRMTHIEHPRLLWNETRAHGSGCRLAAAIAAIIARDGDSMDLAMAVSRAIADCSSDQ